MISEVFTLITFISNKSIASLFENYYTLKTPVNFKFRTEFQDAPLLEQVVKIYISGKRGFNGSVNTSESFGFRSQFEPLYILF